MLPGYDVCSNCNGAGVPLVAVYGAGGISNLSAYYDCSACSGVGSVPGDATVEAAARELHPYDEACNEFGPDPCADCYEAARDVLVAYAQHAKEN